MGIYTEDCEFADPFVSFKGRRRFKQNVSNLGSFMQEVNLKVLDWQESEVCGRGSRRISSMHWGLLSFKKLRDWFLYALQETQMGSQSSTSACGWF